MIYEISQYYEEVVDRRELTYKVSIRGQRQSHGEVICTSSESLLSCLYEAKKMDKGFIPEWTKIPVDSMAMEAAKKAFENGWFQLTSPSAPVLVTSLSEVVIP